MFKVNTEEDWLLWHQQNNFANSENSCKELNVLTSLVTALYSLHNYFYGAIVLKLLPKNKHFIQNFDKELYHT